MINNHNQVLPFSGLDDRDFLHVLNYLNSNQRENIGVDILEKLNINLACFEEDNYTDGTNPDYFLHDYVNYEYPGCDYYFLDII